MNTHDNTPENDPLEMARIIIDNSPIILFRLKTEDPPRLTYISKNIQNFGYTAEEFLNGDITFKDIIHPDDIIRMRDEIQDYDEKK